MIRRDECQKIIECAVAHANKNGATIEVSINGSDIATSRFALNSITQNQAPDRSVASVRVLIDGRQARLESDSLSKKGIEALVDEAIAVAKLLQNDPELPPLADTPAASAYGTVNRFHRSTAEMSPDVRAKEIETIVNQAEQSKVRAAGVYASGASLQVVGNSKGLFVCHEESSAECSLTVVKENSSGWGKAHAVEAASFSPVTMAERAIRTAQLSVDPIDAEPGRYTVVLPPNAVLDLLSFLWYDFAATCHQDQLSSLLDKVGQKVFSENITISDDYAHPLQAGAPFDGEGMPRSVVTLVDKGVLKNLVYGRRSARHFNVKSTGHGLPEPNLQGEYPLNLVVAGGDSSLEEMIKTTERGILLSRVWYVRSVDPSILLLTGMTRDGTFLIEDGQIKKGIKNLRFNVSILELLNNVLALGPAVRAAGEEGFPAVVPAMKVANFHFTSGTKH